MAGGKTFKRDQKRRKEMARKLKQEEKQRKKIERRETKKSGEDGEEIVDGEAGEGEGSDDADTAGGL
jgi:hypothetical protein